MTRIGNTNTNPTDLAALRRQMQSIGKEGQRILVPLITQTTDCNAEWGQCVPCDPTGGAFTVTIQTFLGHQGEQIVVKNATDDATTITIAAQTDEEIDGAATATIAAARGSLTLLALRDGIAIV